MLETPVLLENSSGGAASAAAVELKTDGGGGGREEGDWNSAGNRWPHEETLALLKIRSDMDLAFRDSPHKGPLWDEVSRKMGELGYHRNAKKCKEKFENIYKYHKRTKEGRSGRQNGKNYRFFEQLEAFDSQQSLLPSPPSDQIQNLVEKTTSPVTIIKPGTTTVSQQDFRTQSQFHFDVVMSTSTSTTSSSGKDSSKKKRKLADYFEQLMKRALEKQEGLHTKLLEAIEKCDKDRMAREEEWKRQEMERLKREQESIAQERAVSAAKDAAIIAFLQKITQQPIPIPSLPMNPSPISQKCVENQESSVVEKSEDRGNDTQENGGMDKRENGGSGESSQMMSSSSRWPREEVETLIRVRTNLDLQYQDNGSKGPLWEEISGSMKKFGYSRGAKRCKEKWENINKYYRRVKESQKRRPEDSKTCPYFHMLDSLYQNKSRRVEFTTSDVSKSNMKAGEILAQIISQNQQQQPSKEDSERPSPNQNLENEGEGVDEDDENIDHYQIVANPLSAATNSMH